MSTSVNSISEKKNLAFRLAILTWFFSTSTDANLKCLLSLLGSPEITSESLNASKHPVVSYDLKLFSKWKTQSNKYLGPQQAKLNIEDKYIFTCFWQIFCIADILK